MKYPTGKALLAITFLTSLSPYGVTQDRLNAKQATDACKQEITQVYANGSGIRFNRNPASSIKGGSYNFWINATEEVAGNKGSMRYQCVITRTGELIELTREPGRWRI